MSDIHIEHPHSLQPEELKSLAEELMEKMDNKFDLSSEWEGDTATFRRAGLDGSLKLETDKVVVDIKLGMMMSAFSGTIRGELQKTLADKLG